MIKAIIFDFGGILSIRASLRSFGEFYAPKFGANIEELNKLLVDNWHKARINKIKSKLFWENSANFLKTDKDILRKDFIDYFGFNYEVLEFVKKLKKNYRLGLLSNNIEDWLEEIIEKHKLNKIFDVIVTSYNSRIAKPDIRVFEEIVQKLSVNPKECVYIDDMEKNIPPAKHLGMKTILFKDIRQMKKELVDLGVKID